MKSGKSGLRPHPKNRLNWQWSVYEWHCMINWWPSLMSPPTLDKITIDNVNMIWKLTNIKNNIATSVLFFLKLIISRLDLGCTWMEQTQRWTLLQILMIYIILQDRLMEILLLLSTWKSIVPHYLKIIRVYIRRRTGLISTAFRFMCFRQWRMWDTLHCHSAYIQ